MISGPRFEPPDLSSWLYIQFFMRNPNLRSKMQNSRTQGRKFRVKNSKTIIFKPDHRVMFLTLCSCGHVLTVLGLTRVPWDLMFSFVVVRFSCPLKALVSYFGDLVAVTWLCECSGHQHWVRDMQCTGALRRRTTTQNSLNHLTLWRLHSQYLIAFYRSGANIYYFCKWIKEESLM